jgi:hypothetical protein
MNKKLQAEAKRDGVESVTKAPVHDVLPPRRKRLFHRRRDLRKPQKGLVGRRQGTGDRSRGD